MGSKVAKGGAEGETWGEFLRIALLILSEGGAAIHFAVLADHFDEYWWFGVFFAVAASFQLVWPVLLISRRTRAILGLGALGNGFIIGIWLLSRTVGLPVGPDSGTAETAQFIDVLATAYEAIIGVGCFVLLSHPGHDVAPVGRVQTGGLLALGLLVASLTSLSLIANGQQHHNDVDAPQHGEPHQRVERNLRLCGDCVLTLNFRGTCHRDGLRQINRDIS